MRPPILDFPFRSISLKYLLKGIYFLTVSGFLCSSYPLLASELNTIPYYDYDNSFNLAYPELSEPNPQQSRLEIDLSRRRLTLYQGEIQVKTYPVAVGRQGWRTPVGSFEVAHMIRNPAWTNPFTGQVIGGGDPANPLGRYWIGFWTDGQNWVGMHGTPNPESVGRAASHGCIRLYNDDIQELFTLVSVGTPVTVLP